jgi:hypothetical protein
VQKPTPAATQPSAKSLLKQERLKTIGIPGYMSPVEFKMQVKNAA